MPRYTYRCKECGQVYETRHSMSEEYSNCEDVECQEGSTGVLIKVPSSFMGPQKTNINSKQKVGEVTNRSIEEFKNDLKQEKERLKDKLYEDD